MEELTIRFGAARSPWLQSFLGHTVLTFGVRFLAYPLGLVSTIVIARAIGPEGRGILAALGAVAGFAGQFANLGLHGALTHQAARRPQAVARLARLASLLGLILGAAAGLVAGLVHLFRPGVYGHLPGNLLYLSLIGVPVSLAVVFGQSVLIGTGRVLDYSVTEVAGKLAYVLLVLVVFGFSTGGLLAVIMLQLAAGVIGLLAVVWFLRGHARTGELHPEPPETGSLFWFGLKSYIASLLNYAILRFDIVLLNRFAVPAEHLGQYSVAVQLSDLILLLPVAISTVLFPRVSRTLGNAELTLRTFRLAAPLMLAICGVTALLARPLVVLLFGLPFAPSGYLLHLLLPGILAFSLVSLLTQDLAGRGLPWAVVWLSLPAVAVNIGLNLRWVHTYGVAGAAAASSISYTLHLLLHVAYYSRTVAAGMKEFWYPRSSDWRPLLGFLSRRS